MAADSSRGSLRRTHTLGDVNNHSSSFDDLAGSTNFSHSGNPTTEGHTAAVGSSSTAKPGEKKSGKKDKKGKHISKSEPNLSGETGSEHLRKRDKVAQFFRKMFRKKKKG